MSGDGTISRPYTITNTFVDTDVVTFTAFKQWVGGEAIGSRPDITLELMRSVNGQTPQSVPAVADVLPNPVTLSAGTLFYSWEDLPARDAELQRYTYSVREIAIGEKAVLNGRAGSYLVTNHDRYVTNTYVPEETQVSVRKEFVGGDPNERQPVQVQLFRQATGCAKEFVGEPVALNADNA